MKRILNSLIPAALIISGIFTGCSKDNPTPEPIPEPEPTVPTIVWSANPTFEEYPLSDDMDVNIKVTAPEG
ncbi:MAG: hypothetical protein LUC24_07515, partial [Bacteroidales bacterium]|nr:hypothetical protein [Bacteroidales bacterium]